MEKPVFRHGLTPQVREQTTRSAGTRAFYYPHTPVYISTYACAHLTRNAKKILSLSLLNNFNYNLTKIDY